MELKELFDEDNARTFLRLWSAARSHLSNPDEETTKELLKTVRDCDNVIKSNRDKFHTSMVIDVEYTIVETHLDSFDVPCYV